MVIWVKIKYSYFKKMSFIKVTDPRKRQELIKDFIETRKRIKDNFISRKVGEAEYQTGLTKLFKPITETQKAAAKEITEAQKATAKEITEGLLPIKEGLEKLPSVTFPAYPVVEMTKEEIINIEPIARDALMSLGSKKGIDRTFGIHKKDGKYHIGNKPITIKGNNIIIEDKEYKGTKGLWELIIFDEPDNYTEDDYLNYINLLVQTNTIHRGNNPDNTHPKASKSDKWDKLISPVWDHISNSKKPLKRKRRQQDPITGEGLTILPSDPNALIDRFDLLFTSKKAGHTGVRNEIISILDELKRQGVINTNEYKKLNHLIKK